MKVLVTGATGVVGRRLLPILLRSGHAVTAVTRSPSARAHVVRDGASALDLDLFDASAVRRAVAGQEAVINLATRIPHSFMRMLLPGAWRQNDRLRREASVTLVDACLATDVRHFVQESFAPVYPDNGDRWIEESLPISPVRYNRTVADAEAAADRFAQRGRTGVILRFAGFYGADAFQTTYMFGLVKKGWAPMPGPADAYISSVSHDDAASAAAASIALPSGAYNIVDDEPVTHRQFFDALAAAVGVAPPPLPPGWMATLFGSLGEMASRSQRMSNRKLRTASGWAPGFPSVREGFRAVATELRATPAAGAA